MTSSDKAKKIRVLKRNPINPQVGELWLLKNNNIFGNGGFETGDATGWSEGISGNPTRTAIVSSVAGDYDPLEGDYGYKIVLESYATSNSGHGLINVLRKANVDLNRLDDFSCRYRVVGGETSETSPILANSNVLVRLTFTALQGVTTINDTTQHRSEILLFGGTHYTEAIHKQSNTVIDQWCTLYADLKEIISSRLLAGYTWEDIDRVELSAYVFVAVGAGVNKVGVRWDSFMGVGGI